MLIQKKKDVKIFFENYLKLKEIEKIREIDGKKLFSLTEEEIVKLD